VSNSTLSGNTSANKGGAILNRNGGTLTVNDSTFSGNSAIGDGGAICNDGTLEVNRSTFSGNSVSGNGNNGGAIRNGSTGTATVSNSTFSGNSAGGGGGGISNVQGTLEVRNSTLSGNGAFGTDQFAGGGIGNVFGGVTLKNTIVANSTSGGDCFNFGILTDGGYNLVEDGSCLTAATSLSGDPLLGPLANNGGPTQTMPLQDGSPAIDAIPDGTNGCGTDITQDQRGVSRPQGSACDIGAYEVEVEVVDTTPPTVTDTSPLVPKKSDSLTATFSEPVTNVGTSTFILERQIAVKKASPKYLLVDATVTPSLDGLTAVLNPVENLATGVYRATITTDVTDMADNNLDQNSVEAEPQPKVWFFTVKK
jgi:predicted outer membrane repeat protein